MKKTAGNSAGSAGDGNGISVITLFFIFFRLSMVTFGGGYVIISMMEKEFCERRKWIKKEEMQDIVTLAQSVPGPVAVNASVLAGYGMRRRGGAVAGVMGMALPPLLIILVISAFYSQFQSSRVVAGILSGIRAGMAAIVLDVALSMCFRAIQKDRLLNILIIVAVFLAAAGLGISATVIIIIFLGIGAIRTIYDLKSE